MVLRIDCIRNARAACVRRSSACSGSSSGEWDSGLLVWVLASGQRVSRREFRRDLRLAGVALLMLVLLILLLRGLLGVLVLLFLGLQHALEDLLELAESIGSCLRQAVSGCDMAKGEVLARVLTYERLA